MADRPRLLPTVQEATRLNSVLTEPPSERLSPRVLLATFQTRSPCRSACLALHRSLRPIWHRVVVSRGRSTIQFAIADCGPRIGIQTKKTSNPKSEICNPKL